MHKIEKRAEVIVIVCAILLANPTYGSITVGGIAMAAGLLIRIWVSGNPQLDLNHGRIPLPYRFSRAPHLLGSALQRFGVLFASANSGLMVLGLSVLAFLYHRRWQENETSLLKSSGEYFKDYRNQVSAFLPGLTSAVGGNFHKSNLPKFSFNRAILGHKHRELDGLIAMVLALTTLTLIMKFHL